MIGITHSKTGLTSGLMPDSLLARFDDDQERADYREVAARDDTATIYVVDAERGELVAYAVIGRDDAGLAVIYMARSWLTGLGAIALRSLFAAAKGAGTDLRVHPNSPHRLPMETIRTYARIMGADKALEGVDADSLPMGVFS